MCPLRVRGAPEPAGGRGLEGAPGARARGLVRQIRTGVEGRGGAEIRISEG